MPTKAPFPWPKLSFNLKPVDELGQCQHCRQRRAGIIWIECDQNDRPTNERISVCVTCSNSVIEPHPRLYLKQEVNKPIPGAMSHICGPCKHRDGLHCKHPNLKSNGGPGLNIAVAEPMRGFIDGAKYRGPFEHWPAPATKCAGLRRADQLGAGAGQSSH